jgi:hypothetical protein
MSVLCEMAQTLGQLLQTVDVWGADGFPCGSCPLVKYQRACVHPECSMAYVAPFTPYGV